MDAHFKNGRLLIVAYYMFIALFFLCCESQHIYYATNIYYVIEPSLVYRVSRQELRQSVLLFAGLVMFLVYCLLFAV